MKSVVVLYAAVVLAGCATNDRHYSGSPASQRSGQIGQGFDDQFPYRRGPGLPSTDRQIPARSGPGGLGPNH